MSRRSRGHYPPPQSRVIQPGTTMQGGVNLDQVEQQRQMQEAQVRMRVEGVAAALYSQFVDPEAPDFLDHCNLCSRLADDAALIFARDVWGIQGQRVQGAAVPEGAEPPQPIVEG